MSVHISSVVWRIIMPNAGRKLVAVALADMANDDGACWPSLRTLVSRCNLSEASIRDHLRSLEVIGLLIASPRFKDGRQTSNIYTFSDEIVTGKALHLLQQGEGINFREGGKKQEGEGGDFREGGGYQKLPPHEPSEGTAKEPSITCSSKSFYSDEFEIFWKAYPRKKSKGQAYRAFKNLKGVDQSMILSALRKASISAEWLKEGGQFIPYPATWLNARGWEDGEEADEEQPCSTAEPYDSIMDNPNFKSLHEYLESLPDEPAAESGVDFSLVLEDYRNGQSPDASQTHTDGPERVEEGLAW